MNKKFGIVLGLILLSVICYYMFCFCQKQDNIIVGKDTVEVWNNGVFSLGKYSDGNHLECRPNGEPLTIILRNIKCFKKFNGKIFLYSDDGVAIIYKNDICKVFFFYSDEEMKQGYVIDDDNSTWWFSKNIESVSENVKLITDYNEFQPEEKKVLNNLAIK